MLNRSLPRLPWTPPHNVLNQMETFSLVYLARYPTADLPSRVIQSFSRAWSYSGMYRVPAVDGGRPGYVVATFGDDTFARVTVAIEGMRTVAQLRTFWGAYNTSTYGTFPGRVLAAYAAHAETIYTELMANVNFTGRFNQLNAGITLAGFSLGAAVAEVLAAKFGSLHPSKSIQLQKFASPRVGNAAWVNGRQHPTMRRNFYVSDDLIHLFPYATMANLSTRAFDWAPTHTIFAQNSPVRVRNLDGSPNDAELADGAIAHARASASGLGALTPSNPWYYHNADAYRLMYFNTCRQAMGNQSEGFYRFQALEFDDDNGWQVNYRDGMNDFAGLTQLYDPAPSDREVPTDPAADAMRVNLAARTHTQQTIVTPPVVDQRRPALPVGMWQPRRVRDF